MVASLAADVSVAPSYPGLPVVGALPEVISDRLGFFRRLSQLGDFSRVRFGPVWFVHIQSPTFLQHVLIDNARNYVKQTRGYRMLRLVLGQGLVTSDGEAWRKRRRLAQPAFHHQRIAGFAEIMSRAAVELTERWAGASDGTVVDVQQGMMALTLKVVTEALLSGDVGDETTAVVARSVPVLLEHVAYRTLHPLSFGEAVPTPRNRRFRRAMGAIDRVVLDTIAERRDKVGQKGDLLDMLMEVADEDTGEGLTNSELRDEVMTMFLAGHETTAVALTFTLYLLSQHPEVEARVRDELGRVLGGRTPTMNDLKELVYLDWVLKESMRLYPPVWSLARMAIADDALGGHHVPKGTTVMFFPYIVHRLPEIWANPERFDPERFTPERFAAIPKTAYLPFLHGQRKCIGDGFASVEARLVLATLLQQLRFSLAQEPVLALDANVTLRPAHGLKMRVERA
jgi:cytochrome P450